MNNVVGTLNLLAAMHENGVRDIVFSSTCATYGNPEKVPLRELHPQNPIHRAGFKAFWRWKSRKRAGRPKIDRGLRDLIRRMSKENPQWGASRIHGELLMLGFEVAQSTVSKYMVRGGTPPSQSWKTFLRNNAQAIAAIDLCVVPTLTFERLFAFLVLGHDRRQLLWFEVGLVIKEFASS
jgi:hypothetical protein